jgi:hypothetical protein
MHLSDKDPLNMKSEFLDRRFRSRTAIHSSTRYRARSMPVDRRERMQGWTSHPQQEALGTVTVHPISLPPAQGAPVRVRGHGRVASDTPRRVNVSSRPRDPDDALYGVCRSLPLELLAAHSQRRRTPPGRARDP